MERISTGNGSEQEEFDPESFSSEDGEQALREGIRLFNAGEYYAAHEEIEKCWLATQGTDSDFFKGLIQAAICMHHLSRANVDGAKKLYSGHRKLLGPYLPSHLEVDLERFLAEMQRVMRPVLREGRSEFTMENRPTIQSRTE